MGAYEAVLYLFWLFVGFEFFLFVWNRLPKPRPIDYTTIPGLKLECKAEELPPLSIPPGTPLSEVKQIDGHLEEIQRSGSLRAFLEYSHHLFGPLSSFYWGPRYVVVVSSPNGLRDLRAARKHIVCTNPFAIGSVMLGDSAYSSKIPYESVVLRNEAGKATELLLESTQDRIFLEGPFKTKQQTEGKYSIQTIMENMENTVSQLRRGIADSKDVFFGLTRPLVVVYNKEIDIDAHPVPAWVPIIIHPTQILDQTKQNYLQQFIEEFDFLPGLRFSTEAISKLERSINLVSLLSGNK